MGGRPGLSTILILGSIVLVIAILIGNNMGNRVLGQITSRAGAVATPIPIPSSSAAVDTVTSRALWKRRQVLSVATDPAFPDPRITPEPEIPATPRPAPVRLRSRPTRTPQNGGDVTDPPAEKTPNTTYTSPPLAFPMASQAAEETIAPDAVQTLAPKATPAGRPQASPPRSAPPGRSYPTLPPVSQPSLNP